jgi:hypothetical protein
MAQTQLGTHFSDGVRTGPIYSAQLPFTPGLGIVPQNGVLTSNDYNIYGPGVLHSVQNSYNIKPNIPNPVGYTGLNNIVAAIANIAAGDLTLRGDNFVSFLGTDKTGFPYVQLDWPRVPTVTIAGGADLVQVTRVTIFGYDYYGFPLQHTYVVQARGTYPTVTAGNDAAYDNYITNPGGTALLPAKSFYKITRVYVSQAIPVGNTISIGASAASTYGGNPLIDIFGLPYVANGSTATAVNSQPGSECGVITSIQWGTQTTSVFPNANYILPTTEMTVRVLGGPQTVRGVFVPADVINVPSATSGDVRGLYAPSSPTNIQAIPTVEAPGYEIINATNLIFTYFITGEDTFTNQVAAAQQTYKNANPGKPVQGVPVAPLVPSDAYGQRQFYTGQPS